MALETLDKNYNFASDLVTIRLCSREIYASKVLKLQLGQFWDSISGVPGKKAIWMQPPLRAAEYTIRGKVVASPKFGPW
jgi:hypothetical protein